MRSSISSLVWLMGLATSVSAYLGTVVPCPACPKSAALAVVTVTKQYQQVPSCVPVQVCKHKVCKMVPECKSYSWVSTKIPVLGGASTVTVTKTEQLVALEHVSTVITEIIPCATKAPIFDHAHKYANKTTCTPTTKYTTDVTDIYCPYYELGPIAIPGYGGSGLCEPCQMRGDGSRYQNVTVVACENGACVTDVETVCSTRPPAPTSITTQPYHTSAYCPSAGIYTIPCTQTYVPANPGYPQQTSTFSVVTSVASECTVDVTTIVYVTYSNPYPSPPPVIISTTAVYGQSYCPNNGVHTIPITKTFYPNHPGYTAPYTTTVYYTTTITNAPRTVDCTTTITITFTTTICPTSSTIKTVSASTTATVTASTTSVTASTSAPPSITTSASVSVTTSAPSSVTTSAPSSVTTSAPSSVTTSAPSSVTTSAPSSVTTSAPSSVTTSAPSSVTTSAPSSVTTSAPSSVTTSAPSSVITSAPSSVITSVPSSAPTAPALISTYGFLGCIGSTDGFPTFTLDETSGAMTLELCVSECSALNQQYAGVYNTDCYCADTIDTDTGTQFANGVCNIPCPGNPSEACGGNGGVVPRSIQGRVGADVLFDCYQNLHSTTSSSSTTSETATSTFSSATTDQSSDPDPTVVPRNIQADMQMPARMKRSTKLRRGGMIRSPSKSEKGPRVDTRDFSLKQLFGL